MNKNYVNYLMLILIILNILVTIQSHASAGGEGYGSVIAGYGTLQALARENRTGITEKNEIPQETETSKQENILGYSLLRLPPGISDGYFEQDMPYLLDEAVVGNGVFVSEYMCEMEVFLGNILKEVLKGRGEVEGENRKYFTQWALQQIKESEWVLLDQEWEINPYAYDRRYCLNTVFGRTGYDFFYTFYADREKTEKEETNEVEISVSIDGDGRICGFWMDIQKVPLEKTGMEQYINEVGLFEDVYRENIIRRGVSTDKKMLWNFERYYRHFYSADKSNGEACKGLLASGSIVDSAEDIGRIFTEILESRGSAAGQYGELFTYESYFQEFKDEKWDLLDENWAASAAYDCFYEDYIDNGYVKFQYYFYPDYTSMQADTAMAVVMDCYVIALDGEFLSVQMKMFPMTKQEYESVQEGRWEEKNRVAVVLKGSILAGQENVAVPISDRQLPVIPICDVEIPMLPKEEYVRERADKLWGFSDVAEIGGFLGRKFLKDIRAGKVGKGEIAKLCTEESGISSYGYYVEDLLESGWKADRKYDCYYIKQNEAAGYMHLQYYFYPEKTGGGQESGRGMVVDIYLAEAGIGVIKVNGFRVEC